jgi:hypothetical protein
VAFLDSDDTWEVRFLERMVRALDADRAAVLAYCGWSHVGLEAGRAAPFVPPDYEGPEKDARLLESCRWPIHATLTRREAISQANGFDTRLAVGEDFLLWLEIASFNRIVLVPEVLAHYHHHQSAQASTDKARAAIQTLKAQEIFLQRHPEVAARLGPARTRQLTLGSLLRRGYESYWARDLHAARRIFRTVMRHGYGYRQAWKQMLPALLPFDLHRKLVGWRDAFRPADRRG